MFTIDWLKDTAERVVRGTAIGYMGVVGAGGFDEMVTVDAGKGAVAGAITTLVFCVTASRYGNRRSAAFTRM